MGKMKIGGDTVLVLSGPPVDGEKKDKAETDSSEVVTPTPDGDASTEALVSATSVDDKAPESPEKPICYDKTRSFFDSISCEAVERSKGLEQNLFLLHLNSIPYFSVIQVAIRNGQIGGRSEN